MGLGGYIIWTALAREYHKAYGRKVYFTNRRFGRIKYPRKIEKPDLFISNPHIVFQNRAGTDDADEIRMDNKNAAYWKKVTKDKIIYKRDGHAIQIACAAHAIQNPEIQCEVFLEENEMTVAEQYVKDLGPYVTIEPHTKDSFTVNKRYDFERWQKIVDWLKGDEKKIIQIGEKGKRILNGADDGTGKYSIREVAAIIKGSMLFVGPEGGLMHLANAVDTRSVIVYGGYVSPSLTGYKENINLFSSIECSPCGLRRHCLHDERVCMKMISPEEVYQHIQNALKDRD